MGRLIGAWVRRSARTRLLAVLAGMFTVLAVALPGQALAAGHRTAHKRAHHAFRIPRYGGLDCNGYSRHQRPLRTALACADIRGLHGVSNDHTWNGRFFDNGHYIGHDEPDMVFLSNKPGSGNNVTWTETLPTDPAAMPTVAHPGSDVTHWFELTPAFWFSMMMCDPNSYPLLPCTPGSDENAPGGRSPHSYPGGGSAFMEFQLYPPGFAPWVVAPSADNTHWFGALTIDSLECTLGFADCNPNCTEPVNFAFIQRNGVPEGPPSPQKQNLDTNTPNGQTLLMNPGDRIEVHMWDAPVPGEPGQKAFEVVVHDLTTGQSGVMQASAVNGFQNTSITNCSGTPFNFQPEYNTAGPKENSPWGADQGNILTTVETGHFEPCTSLEHRLTLDLFGQTDTTWLQCLGPYEQEAGSPPDGDTPETSDALCFPAGDTHGSLHSAPDEVTGCLANYFQNGDLDFDGSPYWADWPLGLAPTSTYPGSFVQNLPTSMGRQYNEFYLQTDIALSESTCPTTGGSGCAVPPPNAPGDFYPYWTRVRMGSSCVIEMGNVSTGDDYGKDAQYGTDQVARLGYNQFQGPVMPNTSCGSS